MANVAVEARELTKVFNGVTAVNNVSFDIYEGEILGLLGPNGAGKTTIIQMLLDVITPTSGSIRIFGMDIDDHREEVLSQVNFSSAYVSMPHSLTVLENLRFFARLYGVRGFEQKIGDLLKSFNIEKERNKLTRTLSSGTLSRLYLAKSLLNDPRILFLDEPTASLDPDIADKTRKMLKEIRERSGLTILCTSHNMKEMEELSDRIIFINKGSIVAVGSPREIIERFKENDLEEVFLKIARDGH